jgi:hypothetical protein
MIYYDHTQKLSDSILSVIQKDYKFIPALFSRDVFINNELKSNGGELNSINDLWVDFFLSSKPIYRHIEKFCQLKGSNDRKIVFLVRTLSRDLDIDNKDFILNVSYPHLRFIQLAYNISENTQDEIYRILFKVKKLTPADIKTDLPLILKEKNIPFEIDLISLYVKLRYHYRILVQGEKRKPTNKNRSRTQKANSHSYSVRIPRSSSSE